MKLYVLPLRACLLMALSCNYIVAIPVAPSNQNNKTVDVGELNNKAVKLPIVVPPVAVRKGVHGVVKVRVWIDKKGRVLKTLVVAGPRPLRSSAVRSARGAEFPPDLGNCSWCRYVTGILTYTFVKQNLSDHK